MIQLVEELVEEEGEGEEVGVGREVKEVRVRKWKLCQKTTML